MTEDNNAVDDIPRALVSEAPARFSIVWLVPLVALLVGVAFVYKDYQDKGPTISIQFRSAEGIVPNQTKIKYRDVVVGEVGVPRRARTATTPAVLPRVVPAVLVSLYFLLFVFPPLASWIADT